MYIAMISTEFKASDRTLLVRFVHGYVSNADVAEDIAHDALLRAQRFEWRGEATFTTWLYKIAKNLCVDYYQRKHRRLKNAGLEFADVIQDPQPSILDELQALSMREQVRRAIALLSEADQEMIKLRYYDGLRFHQIAKIQGEKLSTVKNRMTRVKARLKNKLLN